MREFKKLDFPRLREYYTKYPQGYTIYESLLDILEHINEITDVVNLTLNQWEQIETWVLNELKNYSIDQLQAWLEDGTLEDVIHVALLDLDARLSQVKATLDNTLYFVDNTMTQNEIQSVLNNYRNVRFTDGDYHVILTSGSSYVFDVKSHSNVSFDSGARIIVGNTNVSNYEVFRIHNKENVLINGLYVVGDRDVNTASGEWGMGVSIVSSHNIELRNLHITKCWGDGLYIGSVDDGDGGRKHPSNIHVYDSVFDNNRRQGTSIISGKNLRFERCTFSNTQGTLPEAGLDIEPNHQESIEKVDIIDCVFKGNASYSITTKVDYDSSLKYLTVRGCQLLDERNPNMRLHGSGSGVMSDVIIENNTFAKRFNMGSDASAPITLQRVRVLNNVIPTIVVRNVSDFVIARNTLGGKPDGSLPNSVISITGATNDGKITDNLLEQMSAGLITSETVVARRIHVTNNHFINARSGNALTLKEGMTDWIITGNTFYDIFDNGVEIDGTRNIVSNNSFVTVREGRAVKLNESSSRNDVNNNFTLDITNFSAEPILDNGTNNRVDVLP